MEQFEYAHTSSITIPAPLTWEWPTAKDIDWIWDKSIPDSFNQDTLAGLMEHYWLNECHATKRAESPTTTQAVPTEKKRPKEWIPRITIVYKNRREDYYEVQTVSTMPPFWSRLPRGIKIYFPDRDAPSNGKFKT